MIVIYHYIFALCLGFVSVHRTSPVLVCFFTFAQPVSATTAYKQRGEGVVRLCASTFLYRLYTGLVQLDDGSYIYVRSGANLAIGSYYVSKTNDLLPKGTYTFGEDGKMIIS